MLRGQLSQQSRRMALRNLRQEQLLCIGMTLIRGLNIQVLLE